MEAKKLAVQVIDGVGGKENISSFTHCVTRLRFELKDVSKADTEKLSKTQGILKVLYQGGQYQVVIGTEVEKVYNAVIAETGEKNADMFKENAEGEKISTFSKITKKICSCFIPLIVAMIGSGLLKGVLSALVGFDLMSQEGETYNLLFSTADSLFYYLPVFVGFTAAKSFGCNQIIGAVIGASLVHPNLLNAESLSIFGIHLQSINYVSTVFPVMGAVFIAALIEKYGKKYIPVVLGNIVIPFLQIAVVVPLTYLAVGPVMTMLSNILTGAIGFLCVKVPLLAGVILGGCYQLLVVLGLHYAVLPIFISDLASNGYTVIGAPVNVGFFALAGMAIGYGLMNKEKLQKSVAFSGALTSLLGGTEPVLYGVALPNPKHFVSSMIGGAVGGLIFMAVSCTQYAIGASGLFTFPTFISPDGIDGNVAVCMIGCAVSFAISMILSVIIEKREQNKTMEEGKA